MPNCIACSRWVNLKHQLFRDGSEARGPAVARFANEKPLFDCPRGDRVGNRGRPGGHEQRLQEQPSRVVRSNFRYPAPRNWAQLDSPRSTGLDPYAAAFAPSKGRLIRCAGYSAMAGASAALSQLV